MARRIRALAAAALAAAALVSVPPASAAPGVAPRAVQATSPAAPPGTALAYLQARYSTLDTDWDNFSIATRLLTDLRKVDPESVYLSRLWTRRLPATTFFVPTDRAFQTLLRQTTGRRYSSEKTLLLALETQVKDDLDIMLGYGVVPLRLTRQQLLRLGGHDLRGYSGAGGTFHVAVYRTRTGPVVSLWDQDHRSRNPRLILAQSDLNARSRQILHGIDRILWGFSVRMDRSWWPRGGPLDKHSLAWALLPCENPPNDPLYCSGPPLGVPGHGY